MINFQDILNQREQSLEALLNEREGQIPAVLGDIRGELGAARSQAFGQDFQNKVGALGVSGVDTSGQEARLGSDLEDYLSNQGFQMKRNRMNLAFNRAQDRAMQAGLNRQDSEAFARQIMQDELRRQIQAQTGERERKQAIIRQNIQNSAFQRESGLKLDSMANPLDEYNAAVMRMLAGTASQALTSYGLNKMGQQPTTTPYQGRLPSNPTFSTNINPMTGRRI